MKRATSQSDLDERRRQHVTKNTIDGSGDARSQRELMRRQRQKVRQMKLEERFLKKASTFVETFERLTKILNDEIVDFDGDAPTEEVAIVFGATPVMTEICRQSRTLLQSIKQEPIGNIFNKLVNKDRMKV